MGMIKPLTLDNPLTIASEFSEAELTCLSGVAQMDRLMQIFTAPETASPEEQAKFIGCLEDETLLRIFLTGILAGTGPLSVETSACIRVGMEGVDLRATMLAGATGDEQGAMVGGMTSLFLSVMCLNDDEWQGAAAVLGINPEERENLKCVVEQMGGAEAFAKTLSEGDEGALGALFGAAMGCGAQFPNAPSAPGG